MSIIFKTHLDDFVYRVGRISAKLRAPARGQAGAWLLGRGHMRRNPGGAVSEPSRLRSACSRRSLDDKAVVRITICPKTMSFSAFVEGSS